MTTITPSVFSGLTGANPNLINRATALINDSHLTQLEPLRQGLSSGDVVVRYANSGENFPAPVCPCLRRREHTGACEHKPTAPQTRPTTFF